MMIRRNVCRILAVTIGLLSIGCSQPLNLSDPVTIGEWLIEGSDAYGSLPPHFKLFVKFEGSYDQDGLAYYGTLSNRSTLLGLSCIFGKRKSEAFYYLNCSGGITTIFSQGQFSNQKYEGTYVAIGGSPQPQFISMSRE